MTEDLKSLIEERAKWIHSIITEDGGVVSMQTCRVIADGWVLSDGFYKVKWQREHGVSDDQAS
jgi:hypothetical protein